MKILAALVLVLPSAALAHDSFAPHSHPHGPSLLPDVTTLVIGALLAACFYIAARWFAKS
jgi:hypothetical protein